MPRAQITRYEDGAVVVHYFHDNGDRYSWWTGPWDQIKTNRDIFEAPKFFKQLHEKKVQRCIRRRLKDICDIEARAKIKSTEEIETSCN